jgi:putative FmdB family regulatory protein
MMPIFDYSCKSCGERFTSLVGVVADATAPVCPSCGTDSITKLVSRFAFTRSSGSIEDLADDTDTCDPSSMRNLVDGVKDELGDDVGEDFEQMLGEGMG